jgi:hypothetical protein
VPKLIPIFELREGMVLADAVKNKFGQVLIAANEIYEPKYLRMLKTWGINSVCIKQETDIINNSELDEEKKGAALNILLQRLKWNPKNSFEKNLFEMALNEVYVKQQGER